MKGERSAEYYKYTQASEDLDRAHAGDSSGTALHCNARLALYNSIAFSPSESKDLEPKIARRNMENCFCNAGRIPSATRALD